MNRVMVVTNSLTGGGAEKSMNLLTNELWNRGWTVALVPINSSEPDQVVPVCQVFPINRPWQGGFWETLKAFRRFSKSVREWKPDILILNCDLPELFGALLMGKYRLIAVEHSSIPWVHHINLGRLIRRILARRATVWVAVSEHLRIWPSAQIPEEVIPNPMMSIESSAFVSPGNVLGRLIFIGRLSPEKCPHLMLEICSLTETQVQIIGDGLLRPSLENEVAARNLNVLFAGRLSEPWNVFRSGDLLIVPSENEGDGLIVLEGLQRGIPLLLADIEAFRRFDLPDRHYCKNSEEFAERIKEYSNDLQSLVAPESKSESLLALRGVGRIADSWQRLLALT